MNTASWLKIIGFTIGLIPALAGAALTVIYDSGDTQPIAPFLDAFDSTETTIPQKQVTQRPQLGAADLASLLPIRSPGLTPSPIQPKTHDRPFARPFFLVGSDNLSRQWLLEHRDRLKEIGAVGMLIQADTLDDLQTIAELAAGLSVMPASGSDIAKALGLSHYPVLITPHGIEQ
ncbi:integrating conjugative element protein [Sedimenticola selenatireducens]|uniref:integrating conjugative element protein n=1 Tax=Sedimenticola selenatireducens TaxID=191960 RepID=UPI00068866E1|nr:integrating conjugative element protein [Sedimenticola selenatireducens]